MNQQKKISQLRDWLILLQSKSLSYRILETLKLFVTGSFHLWFPMKYREKKFRESLKVHGHLSFITQKIYNKFQEKERSYIFGRKLTVEQEKTIRELQNKGMLDKDIRVLIANRLIDKKGRFRRSNIKEFSLYLVGIVFLLMCVYQFLLFSAMIWFSHMPILYKIIVQTTISIIIIYVGYVMSYFSVKPHKLIMSYRNKR